MAEDKKNKKAATDLPTSFDPEMSMEMPMHMGTPSSEVLNEPSEYPAVWNDELEGLPDTPFESAQLPVGNSDWQTPEPEPEPEPEARQHQAAQSEASPKSEPATVIKGEQPGISRAAAAVLIMGALLILVVAGGVISIVSEDSGPDPEALTAKATEQVELGDIQGAVFTYEQLIATSSDPAKIIEVRRQLIQIYIDLNKISQAIDHGHALVRGESPDLEDLRMLASLYVVQGRAAEAARSFGKVAAHPDATESDRIRALTRLRETGQFERVSAMIKTLKSEKLRVAQSMTSAILFGHYAEADELLAKASPSAQNSAAVLAASAKLALERGQKEKADDLYRQARQVDTSELNIMIDHAHAMAQLGQTEEAISLLKRLTTQAPDEANTHLAHAKVIIIDRLRTYNQDLSAVVQSCQNAETIEKGSVRVSHCNAMAAFARGDIGQASQLLELTLKRAPGIPELYIDLSRVQRRLGDSASAQFTLQEALQLFPKRFDLLAEIGRLHLRREQPDDAEAAFNQIMSRQKDHPGARVGLAEISTHDEFYNRARTTLKKVIAEHPQFVEAYFAMADLNLAQRRTRVAIQQYEAVLEFQPDNVNALLSIAAFRADQHQYGATLDWLEKALKVGTHPTRIANNPSFAMLEGEPEFEALLDKYRKG